MFSETGPEAGTSPPLLEASDLRVAFPSRNGPVEALRGVDLALGKGSLFVLLGPNGAGKTTLMRCITALVRPTGGRIQVFGESRIGPGGGRDWLRRIGVLIENPGVYGRLDTRAYLSFFGSFYGVDRLRERIEALCGAFGLALDSKPVAKLSQGNRQKLQLARSLLHSPDLLLWDEPTDHLDPGTQTTVLAYLRSYLRETGAAALIATHRLEQVEDVATHFGFLRDGRLRLSGPRKDILGTGTLGNGTEPQARVRIAFARPADAEALTETAIALGLSVAAESPDTFVFSGPGLPAGLPDLVKALALDDHPIRAVELLRPSLAEIYAKVMDQAEADAHGPAAPAEDAP